MFVSAEKACTFSHCIKNVTWHWIVDLFWELYSRPVTRTVAVCEFVRSGWWTWTRTCWTRGRKCSFLSKQDLLPEPQKPGKPWRDRNKGRQVTHLTFFSLTKVSQKSLFSRTEVWRIQLVTRVTRVTSLRTSIFEKKNGSLKFDLIQSLRRKTQGLKKRKNGRTFLLLHRTPSPHTVALQLFAQVLSRSNPIPNFSWPALSDSRVDHGRM